MSETNRTKVILLGDSGVGCTSLLNRYIGIKFSYTLMSTWSMTFSVKNEFIKKINENVEFEIWDTPGQRSYRSLVNPFIKSSNICVLVYSITDRNSFNELEIYYYDTIKKFATKDVSNTKYL